jgi:hypothetical protein
MSDYLGNIIARSFNLTSVLQPRLVSLYESASPKEIAPLSESQRLGNTYTSSSRADESNSIDNLHNMSLSSDKRLNVNEKSIGISPQYLDQDRSDQSINAEIVKAKGFDGASRPEEATFPEAQLTSIRSESTAKKPSEMPTINAENPPTTPTSDRLEPDIGILPQYLDQDRPAQGINAEIAKVQGLGESSGQEEASLPEIQLTSMQREKPSMNSQDLIDSMDSSKRILSSISRREVVKRLSIDGQESIDENMSSYNVEIATYCKDEQPESINRLQDYLNSEKDRSEVFSNLLNQSSERDLPPTKRELSLAMPFASVPLKNRQIPDKETAESSAYDIRPEPTIKVTIGRVEVRAIVPQDKPAQHSAPKIQVLSLDDYLRSRNGGSL